MEYHLYPPFFIIEPQTSFDKAWEDLCRQLLCLEHQTDAIQANVAPDLGEDIYWEAEGILYQCKSVEDGKSRLINVTEIKHSIDKALRLQAELRWHRYILCTNVTLSKVKKQELKKYLPCIEFLGKGTWIDLCKKFHSEVTDRFRVLVQISEERVLRALNEAYLHDYEQSFKMKNSADIVHLLIYSDRRKYLFELPALAECTVEDMLITLRELFELPPPRKLVDVDVSVTLDYSLFINNKPALSHQKLLDLVSNKKRLITLWKTFIWYQPPYREERRRFMERNAPAREWKEADRLSNDDAVQIAISKFEQDVETAIVSTAQSFLKHNKNKSKA